jgi:hypothetical protein
MKNANITLISNALNPSLTVKVSGTGVNANAVTPGVADQSHFGNVTVGAPASLLWTLAAANGSVTISVADEQFRVHARPDAAEDHCGRAECGSDDCVQSQTFGHSDDQPAFTSNAANSPTSVPLTEQGGR